MARLTTVLRKRNFFFLWAGQIISQFGDRLTQMVLIGLIYKRAPGSAYELAKLFIFVVVPVFLVGPIAGAYSDRWDKRYTMIVSDILRGLAILFIIIYWAYVPDLKPIFPVYLTVFFIFSVTRFFIPAKMAIIPELISSDRLLEANSLIHITGMIATVLGFGIGGILISMSAIGVKGGLFIDAATFFISALSIYLIRTKTLPGAFREGIHALAKHVKELILTSVVAEIRYGIRYIFLQRKIHFVIILLFLLWSGIGAGYVVMIVFIQKTLASITRDLGLLAMLFGGGLFFGSLVYGKFGQNLSKQKAIFLSLILGGMFLVDFVVFVGIYANFYIAAVISFIFGVSIAPIMISSNTIVYELIPESLRGRIFSSLEAVMHLAFLIFMITTSILAEFISASYILLAVGVIFTFSGIAGLKLTRSNKYA